MMSECVHSYISDFVFAIHEKIIESWYRSSVLIVNSSIPGWLHVGTHGHWW